ncbi:hypothetical protein MTR67_042140 [Solanum verrucosum]|uniref:Uncharacterized protein n=1 Tax=Solanum verrucosum TaxID=315347 RepID=A0AAF0ZTD0_SOLVR|nr:hypothetical protein MTR67_042140 [Solanum verrucosum]
MANLPQSFSVGVGSFGGGAGMPSSSSSAGAPPNKDRKMQFVEQLVLVLCDLNLRENALLELFKVYSSDFGEGVVSGFGPLVVTLIWYYRCTPTTTRVHLQRRSRLSYFFVTYPDVDCGKLTDLSAADVSTEKLVRVAVRHGLYKCLSRDSAILDEKIVKLITIVPMWNCNRGDFEFDVSEGARDNSATGGGDGVLRRNDKSTKAPCRHCGVHNGGCIFGLWL